MDEEKNSKISVQSVIYGAGKYAEILYHRFEACGRSDEIEYFLVSEKKECEQTFLGKNLFSFDEKKKDLAEKNVIVAMSANYSREVMKNLQLFLVRNLYFMDAEENRFKEEDIKELGENFLCAFSEEDSFYNRCIVPRISVIVPVYNSKKYLNQCIDSIIAQTLYDIEIICVDDGSNDGSSLILDKYAEKDGRIRVIHKPNAGYGNSINVGVRAARGKYIGIVESDDYISRNMFEELYVAAIENELDMVKSDCYFTWDSKEYYAYRHIEKMDGFYDRVLTSKDRCVFFGFFMNSWCGIYKRSFLLQNNIVHHESPGASFQDNGFWLQIMYHVDRAMWISKPLYYYRQDNENASVKGDGKIFEMSDEFDWAEDVLLQQGIDENQLGYCHYYHLARHKGNLLRISEEGKKKIISRIIEDYKKYGEKSFFLPDEIESDYTKKGQIEREWYAKEINERKFIKNWYRCFLKDPKLYVERMINTKHQVLERVKKARSLYIMDASVTGQRVMRILFDIGAKDKIKGFITNETVTNSTIAKITVQNFYNPIQEFKNSMIIINAREDSENYRYYEAYFLEKNADSVMSSDDLIDNFYWI